MNIPIINPKKNSPLKGTNKGLVDSFGNIFPIIKGVARISELENYTENFGMQWNRFDKTQLDDEIGGLNLSHRRFFAATRWDEGVLDELINYLKSSSPDSVILNSCSFQDQGQVAASRAALENLTIYGPNDNDLFLIDHVLRP
jgi:hypothetical protein